ncbi:MAG: hypothetical protein U9O94_04410 [Nanoarchaeota archaeon]|nr:hypothetical protein [Nanoarchaeota archaeon]
MKWKKLEIIIVGILTILIAKVYAAVDAPVVNVGQNLTVNLTGTLINSTGNNSYKPYKSGGTLYTTNLDSEQQSWRWKAFVGNVTAIVYFDSDNKTFYEWNIIPPTGEVYTTRGSGTISWTEVNCSTAVNITNEEIALNHISNPNDNITITFNGTDNNGFFVGAVEIIANTCPTTNTYVNSSAPTNDAFEEVLLHDGTNMIYTMVVENDAMGYSENQTYDFQIIVPEDATEGEDVADIAYFFYSEIE